MVEDHTQQVHKALLAELVVELSIQPGLSQQQLQGLLADFTADLQSKQFFELVDSMTYRIISAS